MMALSAAYDLSSPCTTSCREDQDSRKISCTLLRYRFSFSNSFSAVVVGCMMNDEWCDNCGGGMKLRYIHQHKEFRRKPKSKLTVNQFQQQESNATLIVQKQDLNRVEELTQ